MGLNDPVKQTQLPPVFAWVVELGLLTFGEVMLVFGIVRFERGYESNGVMYVFFGCLLIMLGIAIERDPDSKAIGTTHGQHFQRPIRGVT